MWQPCRFGFVVGTATVFRPFGTVGANLLTVNTVDDEAAAMIGLFLFAAQVGVVPASTMFDTALSAERLSDANICETVRGLAARVSNDSPVEVDGTTRLDRVTVVCSIREISFGQAGAMDEAAIGAAQDAVDHAICENPALNAIAQRGWTYSTSVDLADGRAYRDIDCSGGVGRIAVVH